MMLSCSMFVTSKCKILKVASKMKLIPKTEITVPIPTFAPNSQPISSTVPSITPRTIPMGTFGRRFPTQPSKHLAARSQAKPQYKNNSQCKSTVVQVTASRHQRKNCSFEESDPPLESDPRKFQSESC